ncbi:hypothetical protein [Corynebacterium ulceribovis]|uniref:hypothetical protein n=1 Tax=Corynebacterium ulceribovis TaxID=487732 RepID=UPI00035FC37D|nr:hypothetical protein [Corynebacterium ulceribovis]
MCNQNCESCSDCRSFDAHADQALDLVDQVHAAEMTVHAIETLVPDWSWAHTARMWGVALAQAMLIAAVVVPLVLALAWVVVKVSLLW